MKKFLSQAGFTMIELLVVIAVIGVLAVAVLSSINPIEQINKGRDTRARSDAAQLINAADRYYASLEVYPWNVVGATGQTLALADQSPDIALPNATGTNCTNSDGYTITTGVIGDGACQIDATAAWMDELTTTGEVKPAFVTRIQNQTRYAIFAYKDTGAQETMYACFAPSSGAFQREAVKNCFDNKANYDAGFAAIICPQANYANASQAYVNELICLP